MKRTIIVTVDGAPPWYGRLATVETRSHRPLTRAEVERLDRPKRHPRADTRRTFDPQAESMRPIRGWTKGNAE